MRWDTLIQGLGFLIVSIGTTLSFTGLYYYGREGELSHCRIDSAFADSYSRVTLSITVETNQNYHQLSSPVVLPMTHFDTVKSCIYHYYPTLPFLYLNGSDVVSCLYSELDDSVKLGQDQEIPTWKIMTFVLIYLCLCVPCCFVMGLIMIADSCCGVQLFSPTSIRCDRPENPRKIV